MKILLVTGSVNQGGAEFQLLALSEMLKRRGFEVEVLALTDHQYYLPFIRNHQLSYSAIPNKGSRLLRTWKAILAIKRSRPALVISYLRATSLVTIAARIFSFFSFKLIISERTSLRIAGYDQLYFNLALFSNGITVNSTSKYEYIRSRYPLLKSRTFFIPNLINTPLYFNLQRSDNTSGEVRLSFVGRISPEKNLLHLIRAVHVLVLKGYRITLTLAGEAKNQPYLNELQSLIDLLELKEVVHYQGPLKQVDEIYRQTDLLCLVSIFEGFSNVLSEALCCGIPLLASDIEENRYLVAEGVNGFLVPPRDVTGIAAGIEKFLQLDPAGRARIASSNREKAKKIFDEDQIFIQYQEVFRKTGVPV